jgi:O-antigen/teichoic acid export membrane protein
MDIVKKLCNLKNNQGVMKYLKNTSWLLAEKILRMTLGLFVGIWVARYLGPKQLGLFSYAQSFVALFAAFATLGLDKIVIRELIKDETQRDKLLGTSFILKLIGAILVLTLLAVSVFFQTNDYQTNLLIFIIASATVFQSFNVIDFYFQSKVQSKFVVLANSFTLFISSIVKITLILNDAPLTAFAYVVLFDALILSIGFLLFYTQNKLSALTWSFNKNLVKSLLKDSWPMILSGIVVSAYMKIDQLMINQILDAENVGYYAAAVRLSEVWYFIPVAISSSLFPAIVNAKKINEHLYYSRLQDLFFLLTWLALALAIPVTFMGGWIVELLYGSEYEASASVLVIHIWASLFVFLGVARGGWIIIENLQIYTFIYLSMALVVNVTLNYYWIPLFGITGAAYATIVSQCAAVLILPALFNKTRISSLIVIKSLLLVPSLLRLKRED